jgi:hypothetical protein
MEVFCYGEKPLTPTLNLKSTNFMICNFYKLIIDLIDSIEYLIKRFLNSTRVGAELLT